MGDVIKSIGVIFLVFVFVLIVMSVVKVVDRGYRNLTCPEGTRAVYITDPPMGWRCVLGE